MSNKPCQIIFSPQVAEQTIYFLSFAKQSFLHEKNIAPPFPQESNNRPLDMVKNINEKYNKKLKFIINVNEQDQNDSCSCLCFNILTQTW